MKTKSLFLLVVMAIMLSGVSNAQGWILRRAIDRKIEQKVDSAVDKRYWGKAGMPTYYNYPGFEGSMLLATEGFDKKNNPTMKMETKEINENFSHTISTVGITFMKMNFGQAGKK